LNRTTDVTITRTARIINETMNFPIFGAKGRTPWVLNKAEARRKGKKN
jgi:hypothetical protein